MPLPTFIIIGAQKCGTTSLYNYIIEHPEISGASQKEIHFFDQNYSKGLEWYKSQFHGKITGEASPYYIFHPLCPKRIHDTIPDVKLIILLRNPIDRAISHYGHEVKLGKETLSFENALRAESERLKGEEQKILANENYQSIPHQHLSYLSRGRYIEQIKRWYNFFEHSQILILNSEDFFLNPNNLLNSVYDFLGVSHHRPKNFKIFNQGNKQQIETKTREFLSDYFKEYNKNLFEFLGKKFDWD